jgi:hypothetical protein
LSSFSAIVSPSFLVSRPKCYLSTLRRFVFEPPFRLRAFLQLTPIPLAPDPSVAQPPGREQVGVRCSPLGLRRGPRGLGRRVVCQARSPRSDCRPPGGGWRARTIGSEHFGHFLLRLPSMSIILRAALCVQYLFIASIIPFGYSIRYEHSALPRTPTAALLCRGR